MVRPSTSVNFPTGNAQLEAVRENTAGYLGKEVTYENNQLTKKIKTLWDSEATAMSFMQAHSELINQANQDLTTFCVEQSITATRTIENV